ncbi:MAG: hypothetical protein IKD21_03360 [Clostridia bacterium]|nr:hypothetical protein [Clostridia bacterium]
MNEDSNKLLEGLMSALGDNPSETIGQMLSALSASTEEKEHHVEPEHDKEESGFDFDMLLKLQGIMGQLSGDEKDERSALLCALRPFLSEERRPHIDQAIKLLKLSSLAKTAQEMDLFKNLL